MSKAALSKVEKTAPEQALIRIFVADDHPIFREGLKRVVSDDPEFTVVGEAATCGEALEKIDENVDVLLLDLGMPGRGGLSLLKEIRDRYPRLPVLVVSVEPEEMYAVRVIVAGAAGFLQKDDADGPTLKNAIHQVAVGGRYITPVTATRLAEFVSLPNNAGAGPADQRLSDREMEVLRRLGKGQTVSEIADDLSLSVKTVSTYRSRVLEKTGLQTTAQLIRYAIEKGLA